MEEALTGRGFHSLEGFPFSDFKNSDRKSDIISYNR
jgi:hypothetical protein